jgi:DNA-directed RNA polymerase omega subunit
VPDEEKGTFLLVNIAAQRARQLMQGATSLVQTTSRKPAAIAIREVEEGLVPHFMPDKLPLQLEETAAESPETEPIE